MDMHGKRERVQDLNQVCSEEKPNEEWRRAPPVPPPPPPPVSYNFDSCVVKKVLLSASSNSTGLDRRSLILENVMEALADPNTHLIGVYGSDDNIKNIMLESVYKRIQRDNLFDLVLTTTVTRKLVTRRLDMKRIQKKMAQQLGLNFNGKSKDKRAQELIGRIKIVQKILIVLRDLHKGFDLNKVGIPYSSDHPGCKILLTSTTEDVLSNHMHTQKNFSID